MEKSNGAGYPARLVAMAALSIAGGSAVLVLCTLLVPVGQAIAVPALTGDGRVAGIALWTIVDLALSSLSLTQPGRAILTSHHTGLPAVAFLGGPTAAAWVALIGTTEVREVQGRVPWWGVLTTHSHIVIAWTAAAVVMSAVGGGAAAESGAGSPRSLLAMAVGTAVGAGLTHAFAAELVSARTGRPRRDAVALSVPDMLPAYASDAVLSWLVTVAYAAGAWWTALMVPVVDYAAGRSLARHRASWLLGRHPLTDLPNATGLGERVRQLRRAGARGMAVLYLDLDGFKAVNDAHGHAAGDEVLRTTGRRLAEACRDRDFLAHLHGDEFVVVAGGVDSEAAARALADRLVAAIEPPVVVPGAVVSVSATVGIRLAVDVEALDSAVREADASMGQGKAAKARAEGRERRRD